MRFALRVRLVVRALDGADAPSLLDRLDDVYANLVDQEAAHPALRDSDMNATLSGDHAVADVTLGVDAHDADGAVAVGLSCLRAAVHHAGVYTPHWNAPDDRSYAVAATEEAVEATPLAGV